MSFDNFKKAWSNFWASKQGMQLAKLLRYAFFAGIAVYLFYQLYQIGWQKVVASLPTNPLFYLLFLVLYFSLPITEVFIYRISLRFKVFDGFKVFVRKKVLNQDVMGYSGEVYFYDWAKRNLKAESRDIFNIIKDNNIISSFTSTLIAIVLLSYFVSQSKVDFLEALRLSPQTVSYIIAAAMVVIGVAFYFRKRIISLPPNDALKVFGIHSTRIFFVYSLEIFQWSLVLPEVPLHVWFVFLSAKIVASRLPFIPSQDLLFMTVSIEMAKHIDVSGAGIAGIMIANNFLTRCMNLLLYFVFREKGER